MTCSRISRWNEMMEGEVGGQMIAHRTVAMNDVRGSTTTDGHVKLPSSLLWRWRKGWTKGWTKGRAVLRAVTRSFRAQSDGRKVPCLSVSAVRRLEKESPRRKGVAPQTTVAVEDAPARLTCVSKLKSLVNCPATDELPALQALVSGRAIGQERVCVRGSRRAGDCRVR